MMSKKKVNFMIYVTIAVILLLFLSIKGLNYKATDVEGSCTIDVNECN